MIRSATQTDAAAVAHIYNHYVESTVVTFETDPVSDGEMAGRIDECRHASLPWLVAEDAGEIIGYAYASKWKGRCAYRYAVEATVYLDHRVASHGWGTKLYGELFAQLKQQGLHTVIGGIALPNPASVALHEKFGMEKVAHFREVGFKFDRWIDVGYWQALLDS
ncbi:N-acetyltransferase [Parahaliea maris]|uniref:N-acetyltransferase n=1 Tax=Parahaliea maris TaxID=2716870 RepID=A0A5C8ZWG5_9GAMM|nr:arsinothricin resistance N-acetyltransferase ArsN1 family B [Parahaliea maris]TXS92893.1 N-acetyltransferase [Parahaliea maris]